MAVELNHTIIACRDKKVSAQFLSSTLGLQEPFTFGHFLCVDTANGVSLDFLETKSDIRAQHYAFLISETEFDEIFARIEGLSLDYWADPMRSKSMQINTRDGGRGVYFPDPDGHLLEVLTRPYGSGSDA
jgi:catechol 2,3-dioxygenase-like lactoylglutathione lyase family enzyme